MTQPIPKEKLVYMPEESTPTIATEGNRVAVAYLELGERADQYGRLFAASSDLLDVAKMSGALADLPTLAEAMEVFTACGWRGRVAESSYESMRVFLNKRRRAAIAAVEGAAP